MGLLLTAGFAGVDAAFVATTTLLGMTWNDAGPWDASNVYSMVDLSDATDSIQTTNNLVKYYTAMETASGGTTPTSPSNPITHLLIRVDHANTVETTTNFNIQFNLGSAATGYVDHVLQMRVTGPDAVSVRLSEYVAPYPLVGAFTTGSLTLKSSNLVADTTIYDPTLVVVAKTGTWSDATLSPTTGYGFSVRIPFGFLTKSAACLVKADGSGSAAMMGAIFTTPGSFGAVATIKDKLSDAAGTYQTLQTNTITGATTFESSAASSLAYVTQPTGATAGQTLPSFTVEVRDTAGARLTTATHEITVAIGTNPSSGTLSGTKTVSAVAGLATFSGLSIDNAGTGYTLVASTPGLTSATSSAFDIAALGANRVGFIQQPTSATAGASISPSITVAIQDSTGATVTTSSASVTLAFGTNAGNGTLSGTLTRSASSGVATFNDISINKAANGYTLVASSTGLTSTTSNAFNVAAAAANAAQTTASVPAGTSGSVTTITVTVRDAYGNLKTGQAANLVAAVTGANTATIISWTDNGDGTYTGTYTPTAAGTDSVAITLSLVPISGSPYSSTVSSGTASQIVLSSSTTDLAAGSTRVLTATIQDANGNTVTSGVHSSLIVTFAKSSGAGTVTGLGTATASAGVATITITGALAGNISLQASTTSPSITSNSLSLAIVHGAGSQLVLAGSTSDLASGTSRALTATLKDAYGNTVSSGSESTSSVTFAQTSGAGSLSGLGADAAEAGVASITVTGALAGNVSLQANTSSPSLTSDGLAFVVVHGDTAAQLVISDNAADLSSGDTRLVTATLKDAAGNTITSGAHSGLVIQFAKLSGSGTVTGLGNATASAGIASLTVTGAASGSITLRASTSAPSLTSAGLTFNVVASQTAASIVLSASAADLNSGSTRILTATLQDASGNTVTAGPHSTLSILFSKTGGSGTVTGLTSATAVEGVASITITGSLAGSIDLQASTASPALASNSLTFSVIPSETAASIVLAASTADLNSGSTRSVSATIKDAAGNTVIAGPHASLAITFAKSAGTATVTGLGTATASAGIASLTITGEVAGNISLVASSSSPSLASSALSFNVIPSETASLISLSASAADLSSGSTRLLTATLQDAAGNTVTAGPHTSLLVSFAQVSGAGSVTGLGSATASGGIAQITVTGAGEGNVSLQASTSSPGLTSPSLTFAVVAGQTATQLVLTGTTADLASGSTRLLTATLQDASGNTVTAGPHSGLSVTFSQTSGAGTLTGLVSATAVAGVATLTVTGAVAGNVSLQATTSSPALTSNSLAFAVTPSQAAAQIVISGATADLASGTARTITATIQDASGNTVIAGSNATLSVLFAKTAGAGTVSGLGSATAVAGVATIDVSGQVAGNVSIQASSSGPALTSSALSFAVVPSTIAAQIILTGASSDLNSGDTRVLTGTIQDAAGNTVTSGAHSGLSINFAKVAGAGTLSGLGAIVAVAGIASLTVTASLAGSVSVQASTSSPDLSSNNLTLQVVPSATAASIEISTSAADLESGATRLLTATLKDAAGNTVSSGNHSTLGVTFFQASGAGNVSGLGAATAVAGVATLTITGQRAGAVGVQVSSSTPNLTSGTASFLIVPSQTPAQIVLSGDVSDLASAAPRLLTATLVDAAGNTIVAGPNASLSVQFAKISGTASLSGLSSAPASQGVASLTVNGLLAGTIGLQASTASPSLASNVLSFDVVANESAAQIMLSASAADLASGATRLLSATIVDAAGNTIEAGPNASLVVNFTKASGAGTLSGLGTATALGGVASRTVTGVLVGNVSLQASTMDPSLSSATIGFSIVPGAAQRLAILIQPVGAAANVSLGTQPVVRILDAAGNVVTTDATTQVTAAIKTGPGSLAGTVVRTASSGVVTYDDLRSQTRGTITIEFTAAGLLPVTSDALTIVAAAPDADQSTASVPSGTSGLPTNITITLRDAFGNLVVGAAAQLSGNISGNNTAAIASFLDNGDGTYTGSYTPVNTGNDSVMLTLGGLAIGASPYTSRVSSADAVALQVHVQPSSSATAGIAFAQQPVIRIIDAAGNLVSSDSSTQVSVAIATGPGTLVGTLTVTAINGVATFSGLKTNTSGNITLSFTASGLSSANSGAILVSPAAADRVQTTASVPSGVSGSPTSITITVRDAFGNLVPGAGGQLGGVVGGANAANITGFIDNGDGTYTANYTPTWAGNDSVAITLGGLPISTSPHSSLVSHGPAAALQIVTQPSSSATAGVSFAQQPVVRIVDAAGNIVTSDDTSQVSAAIQSGPGSLAAHSSPTAAGGIATFSGLKTNTSGTITLRFSLSGLTGATSAAIVVSAAAANASMTSASVPDGASGAATTIVITVRDAFGNLVAGAAAFLAADVNGANTDAIANFTDNGDGTYSGSYTPIASGNDTIAITLAGLPIGASPYVSQVSPASASALSIQTQPSSSATAGVAFARQPVISISDGAGNPAIGDSSTEVTVTIRTGPGVLIGTTTATAVAGVVTFSGLRTNTSGTITLEFTAANLSAAISAAIVVSAAAPDASQTTADVPDGTAGSSTLITITVRDAFGNLVTNATGLSISVSGNNTAAPNVTSQGDGTYTASYVPTQTGDYTVTILLGASAISLSPYISQVGPAAAASLEVATQPSATATAGTPFAQQPIVRILDAQGNLVTTDGSTIVTVSIASGPGSLLGTTERTASAGLVSFGDLQSNTKGTITLLFTASGLDSASSASIVIGAAAASAVNTTASVGSGTVGQATTITVTVRDAYNNLITGGASLSALVSGNNTANISSFTSNGDGTYSATYTPTSAGNDSIVIRLGLVGISGSPYTSVVQNAPGLGIAHTSGSTQVSEPGAGDNVSIVLARQPLSDVVVDLSSSSPGDIRLGQSSLTFTNSNWDVPQVVALYGLDDDVYDGNEAVTIMAQIDAANSSDEYDAVTDATLAAAVLDNDQPASVTLSMNDTRLLPNRTASLSVVAANATGVNVTLLPGACTWDLSLSGNSTFIGGNASDCDQVMSAGPIRGSIYSVSVSVGGVSDAQAFWIIAPTLVAASTDPDVIENKTTLVEPMTIINMMPVLVHEEDDVVAGPAMLNMVFFEPAENTASQVLIVTEERSALPAGVPLPMNMVNAVFLEIGAWENGRPVSMSLVTVRFMIDDSWLAVNCAPPRCSIRLYHYTAGAWEILTPNSLGSDGTRTTYEAFVTSLSPFVIGGAAVAAGGGGGGGLPPATGARPVATSPPQVIPDDSGFLISLPGPGSAQPIGARIDVSRVALPMWAFLLAGLVSLGAGLNVAQNRYDLLAKSGRAMRGWLVVARRRSEEEDELPAGPWAPVSISVPATQIMYSRELSQSLTAEALAVNKLLGQIRRARLQGLDLDPDVRAAAMRELAGLNRRFARLRSGESIDVAKASPATELPAAEITIGATGREEAGVLPSSVDALRQELREARRKLASPDRLERKSAESEVRGILQRIDDMRARRPAIEEHLVAAPSQQELDAADAESARSEALTFNRLLAALAKARRQSEDPKLRDAATAEAQRLTRMLSAYRKSSPASVRVHALPGQRKTLAEATQRARNLTRILRRARAKGVDPQPVDDAELLAETRRLNEIFRRLRADEVSVPEEGQNAAPQTGRIDAKGGAAGGDGQKK